ncbi:MAG: hypothetical protein ABI658_08290 [Acidimicrobiales bacterium]
MVELAHVLIPPSVTAVAFGLERAVVSVVSEHFEVSDGSDVVMRLPSLSYGALYQTMLLDRVIEHVKEGQVACAWAVVADASALAESVECPWCDHLGLHELCWSPRVADSV